MSDVTREEMLEWTCKAHETFPDDINVIYAIRRLVEKFYEWQTILEGADCEEYAEAVDFVVDEIRGLDKFKEE